ncbi:hypothetical protein BJ912DRAFT_704569 [Pholiota molesta]|nr:hypothetical protein BJ912DRAFT_704569 [Pholiota molesta]
MNLTDSDVLLAKSMFLACFCALHGQALADYLGGVAYVYVLSAHKVISLLLRMSSEVTRYLNIISVEFTSSGSSIIGSGHRI